MRLAYPYHRATDAVKRIRSATGWTAGIDEKAAALLHLLACNHGLIDGNKRLALAATLAFYGMNGVRLALTNDEAYRLVIRVACGGLADVAGIVSALERGTTPRG